MRAIATLAAAAALLALAGCDRLGIGGGGVADANQAANESGNASAGAGGGKDPAGQAQAPAEAGGAGDKDLAGGATPASSGGVTLDRAYIAGRWTDNGDCSIAGEFVIDGRFVANNGNELLWTLQGDRLTIQGERAVTLQIVPIDQDTMNVINPDGSLGRSTRC